VLRDPAPENRRVAGSRDRRIQRVTGTRHRRIQHGGRALAGSSPSGLAAEGGFDQHQFVQQAFAEKNIFVVVVDNGIGPGFFGRGGPSGLSSFRKSKSL